MPIHPVAFCNAFPCASQNAACVNLFPVPLARPGFYPVSFDEFASCIPAAACPGVDTETVEEAFSRPVARGVLRCDTHRALYLP